MKKEWVEIKCDKKGKIIAKNPEEQKLFERLKAESRERINRYIIDTELRRKGKLNDK